MLGYKSASQDCCFLILNIAKYARGAFEHRSDAVIKASDAVLLIHDGASKGTANELKRVKKFKKKFFYEVIKPTSELEAEEAIDSVSFFDFGIKKRETQKESCEKTAW